MRSCVGEATGADSVSQHMRNSIIGAGLLRLPRLAKASVLRGNTVSCRDSREEIIVSKLQTKYTSATP